MTEMPSENDVLETKKKRFRVLNTIYDLAEQDEQKDISTYEIKNKTEILGKELYLILKFLINQGLVKNISSLETEAISKIDSNSTLAARILTALEAGGISAFEQFLNHPAASFVIGALADWQKTKGI